ncbi:MAG: hypothetical protein FJ044_01725 [Candidatus Cloacimonetes bacterium]|nr:hypothetical protein [Candidatus Cloacimonadota bacterium]
MAADGILTYFAGGEANPIWQIFVKRFGFNIFTVLAGFIPALILFYLVTKIGGWLITKVDQYPEGEEIVLTGLVIAYSTWVFYLAFLRPIFGYFGSRSHYRVIPFLMVPLIIYTFWLERRKKI